MSLRAVIFDFDFTLVDSSQGFVDCYHHAAARLNLPTAPSMTAMAMMGTPLADAFRLLYPERPEAMTSEFVALWQARADEVMTDLTFTFPATEPAIDALGTAGLGLGIVSQKLRRRIEAVLRRDNLAGRFGIVVGGEDMAAFKPHPDGLLKAMDALGAEPDQSLYVGDTVIDGWAAANAGVRFVAVLSGVTPREDFTSLQPLAILDTVADLPGLCLSLS